MPSRAHGTIKEFARTLFLTVNFTDIHGRSVGLDYDFILARIKERYPEARTSRRWLQDMAYLLQRTEKQPMRRRTRSGLAEDFAMALLLRRTGKNVYRAIRTAVKKKFPDHPPSEASLKRLERRLRKRGFTIPERS